VIKLKRQIREIESERRTKIKIEFRSLEELKSGTSKDSRDEFSKVGR